MPAARVRPGQMPTPLFDTDSMISPLRAQINGDKMPIGTIGSGHIGSTIGGLWVKNGHKVLFSSRHPEELKDMVAGLGPLA